MFHGLLSAAPLVARIRSHTLFKGFVVGPDCLVEDLKGCLTNFRSEGWKSWKVVSIVECSLARWNGYAILDSGLKGRGYPNGSVQKVVAFQTVPSA
jgi:hypothetical protein